MRFQINVAQYCQLGRRNNQEDSLYPQKSDNESRLFLVCDGVGGSEKGELASSAICRLIPQELQSVVAKGQNISDKQVGQLLKKVVKALPNEHIGTAATTMTMLYLNDKGALIVHVGDSRVYQYRKSVGRVFCTKDHSLVQGFVDAGLMTEDEARNHPKSNIITRALRILDADETLPPPTIDRITDIQKGDVFLLCSDGVWGEFTEADLSKFICQDMSLSERSKQLAEATKDSHDNNTAILVEIADVECDVSWWKKLFK